VNGNVSIVSRGDIFRGTIERIRRNNREKDGSKVGEKGEKINAKTNSLWSIFLSSFFSRAFYLRYFSLSITFSSLSRRLCLGGSVRSSSSLTPNLGVVAVVVVVVSGWWWLWWGGSWFLRAYTAPYLSFLSL